MIPSNHAFQWETRENSMMVATEGLQMGTKILVMICHCPAPSTMAASSSSEGTVRKKLIISTTLNTGTAPGSTSAQIVPRRCRLFTVINAGISPPLISMVRKKNQV